MKINTERIKKENDLLSRDLKQGKKFLLFSKAINEIIKTSKFKWSSVVGGFLTILEAIGLFIDINSFPNKNWILSLAITITIAAYIIAFLWFTIKKMNKIHEEEIEEIQKHQQKIKEFLESLDTIRNEFQKDLFSNIDKIHDVIHNIRDSLHESLKDPENPFPNFNFEKLIQMTLDELKEFFEHIYNAKFVATLMEVDDSINPESLTTMFYSSNASEVRKKFRSIVPLGEGVAGKMIDVYEPEPEIWDKDKLYRKKFKNKKNEEIRGDDRRWNPMGTKKYENGISSPFKVGGLVQGVISIDTISKDIVFLEEDKYIVKTFGDICALIYEINGIKKILEPQYTETKLSERLRKVIEEKIKDGNK